MSVLKPVLSLLRKSFGYVLGLLLTLCLVTAISVYWLSNELEQQHDEIAHWISDTIGYQVELGSTGISWVGFVPKLEIGNIVIHTDSVQSAPITLNHLYLGLDPLASLRQASPVLEEVIFSGLDINVSRDHNGLLFIEGLKPATSANQDPIPWSKWSTVAETVRLNDVNVHFTDQITTELSGDYSLHNSIISRDDNKLTANAFLKLPKALGQFIKLGVNADITPSLELKHWQVDANIDALNMAVLTQFMPKEGVRIEQGRVSSHLLMQGNDQILDSAEVQLNVSELELKALSASVQAKPVSIKQMSGEFNWQTQQSGWALSSHDLSIDGANRALSQLGLSKHNDLLSLTADSINIEILTNIAALSSAAPDFIAKNPVGELSPLAIEYSEKNGLEAISFKLLNGGFDASQTQAGISGLSASVDWNTASASIELNSHDFTIYSDRLLDRKVTFDTFTGEVKFEKKAQDWTVSTNQLAVINQDMNLELNGSVSETDSHIRNDLALKLNNFEVNTWKRYVPQHILRDDFKHWSNNAFLAGRITSGLIRWQGTLDDFPYESKSKKGVFDMQLPVSNFRLHFGPGWPDLENVNGSINTDDSTLVIKSNQGSIAGFKFDDVTTKISRFMLSNPILTTDGHLDGTTQQALDFLKNSPLKERFESVSQVFNAKGNSRIKLNLMVPLINVNATQASGTVSFINSELQNRMIPEVIINKVNGLLSFNNDGVTAKDIRGQLYDQTVTVDVQPKDKSTLIIAKSHITSEGLSKLIKQPLPDFVSGETDYQLKIKVLEKSLGDFYVEGELNSDLRGVSLDLPAPLGKQETQAKALTLAIEQQENSLVYGLNYDQTIKARVMPKETLWAGEIRFGLGEPVIPSNGIKVRGQLDKVSIDDWSTWFGQHAKTENDSSLLFDSIDDVSVSIGKLSGFNQYLTQLNISAQKDLQGWRTEIYSEQTKGSLYLPKDFYSGTPITLNLDKFQLHLSEVKSESVKNSSEVTSKLWPAVNIDIGRFMINDMNLGTLHLSASRTEHQWKVEQGTLSSPNYSASILAGSWRQTPEQQHTRLKVEAKSTNFSAFLVDFGFLPSIDSNNVDLKFDVNSATSPSEVVGSSIKGNLSLALGNGRLNDIEPGAAGRIFGLMSITAILKRLTLDFSNLFSKGLGFSSINANFTLSNGIANTSDMKVSTDAATINITGPIDLDKQQYQQKVTIKPNVSSSLPLAGAVAGGPVGLGVGTAILIADKLVGQLFDKNIVNVISYKYDLTGPWAEPQLTAIKPSQPE